MGMFIGTGTGTYWRSTRHTMGKILWEFKFSEGEITKVEYQGE